jgi:hypothetical protein
VAVLGLWLWKGGAGLLPTDRELVWQLPGEQSSIRQVEIQIWDDGELLKREQLSFPHGPGAEVVERLPLRPGNYQTRVFVKREGQLEPENYARELRLAQEQTVVTSLR